MTHLKSLVVALMIPMGVLLLLMGALLAPQMAQAQCGASASSCKNCHEVNAQYPVNTSGDWHISHAFGDFCAFCHAGNVQAKEQTPAHEGMIYPLADPQGSCQACHPADYLDLAQVYATTLGVDLASESPGAGTPSDGAPADLAVLASEPISPPGERHASGALIDYNRRYEIEVLGHVDGSVVGNTILAGAGVLLLVVGFVLVWRLEKLGDVWRSARATPVDDWRRLAYSGAYDVSGPVIARPPIAAAAPPSQPALAPSRLAAPLPDLGSLDPAVQSAVNQLLADPERGGAILRALARLDPALINSLQSLDKKDRDLLLAVVEQLGESKS